MTTNKEIADQNSHSARIYNESGALKDLLKKITDPKMQTLEDVLQFKNNYAVTRKKIVSDSIAKAKQRISKMIVEMDQLKIERDEAGKKKSEELNITISRLEEKPVYAQRNFFAEIFFRIKRWQQDKKLKYLKSSYQIILNGIAKEYAKRITNIENEIKYTENNIQTKAEDPVSRELNKLDSTYKTIEDEKYLVYGAIGETHVITELKKLPKTYQIINNFRKEFSPPIYNRTEDDRIYSIQVDHLVIGPTGVFIIETKYWSNSSISNEVLFSPVKQVKRAGFALFVLLNGAINSGDITRLVNHWGERKISPKQIVVCVSSVPHVEFQYVKVLGVEKLNSYIRFGKNEFTEEETQAIVNYLV